MPISEQINTIKERLALSNLQKLLPKSRSNPSSYDSASTYHTSTSVNITPTDQPERSGGMHESGASTPTYSLPLPPALFNEPSVQYAPSSQPLESPEVGGDDLQSTSLDQHPHPPPSYAGPVAAVPKAKTQTAGNDLWEQGPDTGLHAASGPPPTRNSGRQSNALTALQSLPAKLPKAFSGLTSRFSSRMSSGRKSGDVVLAGSADPEPGIEGSAIRKGEEEGGCFEVVKQVLMALLRVLAWPAFFGSIVMCALVVKEMYDKRHRNKSQWFRVNMALLLLQFYVAGLVTTIFRWIPELVASRREPKQQPGGLVRNPIINWWKLPHSTEGLKSFGTLSRMWSKRHQIGGQNPFVRDLWVLAKISDSLLTTLTNAITLLLSSLLTTLLIPILDLLCALYHLLISPCSLPTPRPSQQPGLSSFSNAPTRSSTHNLAKIYQQARLSIAVLLHALPQGFYILYMLLYNYQADTRDGYTPAPSLPASTSAGETVPPSSSKIVLPSSTLMWTTFGLCCLSFVCSVVFAVELLVVLSDWLEHTHAGAMVRETVDFGIFFTDIGLDIVVVVTLFKNPAVRPQSWYHWLSLAPLVGQHPLSALLLGFSAWWGASKRFIPDDVLQRGYKFRIFHTLCPCCGFPPPKLANSTAAEHPDAEGGARNPGKNPGSRPFLKAFTEDMYYALRNWGVFLCAWLLTTLAFPLMDLRAALYLFQSALWGYFPTDSVDGFVFKWRLWIYHTVVFAIFLPLLTLVNLLLAPLTWPWFMYHLFSEKPFRSHWEWSWPIIEGYRLGSIVKVVEGFRRYGCHMEEGDDDDDYSTSVGSGIGTSGSTGSTAAAKSAGIGASTGDDSPVPDTLYWSKASENDPGYGETATATVTERAQNYKFARLPSEVFFEAVPQVVIQAVWFFSILNKDLDAKSAAKAPQLFVLMLSLLFSCLHVVKTLYEFRKSGNMVGLGYFQAIRYLLRLEGSYHISSTDLARNVTMEVESVSSCSVTAKLQHSTVVQNSTLLQAALGKVHSLEKQANAALKIVKGMFPVREKGMPQVQLKRDLLNRHRNLSALTKLVLEDCEMSASHLMDLAEAVQDGRVLRNGSCSLLRLRQPPTPPTTHLPSFPHRTASWHKKESASLADALSTLMKSGRLQLLSVDITAVRGFQQHVDALLKEIRDNGLGQQPQADAVGHSQSLPASRYPPRREAMQLGAAGTAKPPAPEGSGLAIQGSVVLNATPGTTLELILMEGWEEPRDLSMLGEARALLQCMSLSLGMKKVDFWKVPVALVVRSFNESFEERVIGDINSYDPLLNSLARVRLCSLSCEEIRNPDLDRIKTIARRAVALHPAIEGVTLSIGRVFSSKSKAAPPAAPDLETLQSLRSLTRDPKVRVWLDCLRLAFKYRPGVWWEELGSLLAGDRVNEHLTELGLHWSGMVGAIWSRELKLRNLRKLSLSNSYLGMIGKKDGGKVRQVLEQLLDGCRGSLEELDLSGCGLGDEGVKMVSELLAVQEGMGAAGEWQMFPGMRKLRELNLENNGMTAAGAVQVLMEIKDVLVGRRGTVKVHDGDIWLRHVKMGHNGIKAELTELLYGQVRKGVEARGLQLVVDLGYT